MRALLAAILILIIGGAIAAGAYETGLAQGAAQIVVPAAAAAPAVGAPVVAYYGHPYGWGWVLNPFGLLFPIFGIFLFFALMRALVSSGGGHHRGWSGSGEHGVSRRFEEWHTRAHGDITSGTVPPRQ